MLRNDYWILRQGRLKITKLLIVQLCALNFSGCWYMALTRHFVPEIIETGRIYEWYFSVTLAAFFREDKKEFVKRHGRPHEEFHDYDIYLTFWTIAKIDTTLSNEERHEARVDSLKISFGNYIKVFATNNAFTDNTRKKEFGYVPLNYLYARTEMSLGSIYIPPGTQAVDITVYGMFRSQKYGVEPFQFSTRLKYEEKSERISKYD